MTEPTEEERTFARRLFAIDDPDETPPDISEPPIAERQPATGIFRNLS